VTAPITGIGPKGIALAWDAARSRDLIGECAATRRPF
jgi:hypothetical protein